MIHYYDRHTPETMYHITMDKSGVFIPTKLASYYRAPVQVSAWLVRHSFLSHRFCIEGGISLNNAMHQ